MAKLQKPVFFDHDGGIDDLVALILLLSMDNIRLTGVSVINADCFAENAIESTLKIFSLFCRFDLEVARSEAEAIHPFPDPWRAQAGVVNGFEELYDCVPDFDKYSIDEGADFMAMKINQEEEKTTVVMTGPASNMVRALELHPEIADKIDQIIWMGGAFLENGNVQEPDHDGSAEWNVYWDPISAKKLMNSGLNIILFPLDACCQVPVDNHFMFELGEQKNKSRLSSLVYRMYSLVANHENYCMWDVITAAYAGLNGIVRLRPIHVDVEIRGTSKGSTYRSATGGRIRMANCVDESLFYEYLLEKLTLF